MKNLLLLGGDINMDLGTIGTKIDDIDVEISYFLQDFIQVRIRRLKS